MITLEDSTVDKRRINAQLDEDKMREIPINNNKKDDSNDKNLSEDEESLSQE